MMNHSRIPKVVRAHHLLVLVALIVAYSVVQPVAATAGAQIQNESTHVDSLGFFHVVGEVMNTGDAWLRFVRVTGTFTNASGQVVDVTFTYTFALYLPPAQKAPFDLFEADAGKSSKIASYALALDFQKTTKNPENTLIVESVSSSTDNLGFLNVVGQVKNSGAQTSNFTKVIGTFYGQDGKVIYVDFTYTSPNNIPSGQTYGFKLMGPNAPISTHVVSYDVITESSQYTSIPELQLQPTLLAGALVALALVILRKKSRLST